MRTQKISWEKNYKKIPCSTAGIIVNIIVITALIIAFLIGGWKIFKITCFSIFVLWMLNALTYHIRAGYIETEMKNTYSQYTIINIITLVLCSITIYFFSYLGTWGYVILATIIISWFLVTD